MSSVDDVPVDSSVAWAAFHEGRGDWSAWVEARVLEERRFVLDVVGEVIGGLTDDLERKIEKGLIEMRMAARPYDGRDGRGFSIKGTWNRDQKYFAMDVVVTGGASFAARHDNPGPCPGDGWQLVASQGKRGLPGPQGEPGRHGRDAAAIKEWHIDRANFVVTPLMNDGSAGPPLYLRELFQSFLDQTG
jgi:hypothetical protein